MLNLRVSLLLLGARLDLETPAGFFASALHQQRTCKAYGSNLLLGRRGVGVDGGDAPLPVVGPC
jgi:hypothetical protein